MIPAFITWNISPEIFRIGPLAVRWYGLLFASGFVIGYYIMANFFENEKKPQKDLEALTIFMIVGTVIGARLGHCLFYEPLSYLSNPITILKVWEGGLASHGAAVGILFSVWFFVRKRKNFTFMWVMDRIVIVVALAGCLIRLGNFFNSEIIGAPANVAWAVIFSKIDLIPRHPAQLYEALCYLLIFIYLFFSYRKNKGVIPQGKFFGIFLILVFGARFFIEFVKEVQVTFENGLPLNMGQLLSIPFVIAGFYLLYKSGRKQL